MMKTRWNQASSLALLSLIVTCIATLDTRSIVTDVLDVVEFGLKDEISDALSESDGVLAQFTMDHKTYSST